MKRLKQGMKFLILIGLLIINIPIVNAGIEVVDNVESYEAIPPLQSQSYVFENETFSKT